MARYDCECGDHYGTIIVNIFNQDCYHACVKCGLARDPHDCKLLPPGPTTPSAWGPSEDGDDLKAAEEALEGVKKDGTVPWEELKTKHRLWADDPVIADFAGSCSGEPEDEEDAYMAFLEAQDEYRRLASVRGEPNDLELARQLVAAKKVIRSLVLACVSSEVESITRSNMNFYEKEASLAGIKAMGYELHDIHYSGTAGKRRQEALTLTKKEGLA